MPKSGLDMANYEVFLVGRYFCDLVFTDLPEFPRLGHEVYSGAFNLVPGGVYTPAVALHRLGVRVAWPCRFGCDPFSRYVKEQAINEGVDSTFLRTLANHLYASPPLFHLKMSAPSSATRTRFPNIPTDS